ncbi:hemoblobin-interacting domain-containing protein [Clostridium botulinum]|uniref:hemoblobin-interacting domain-containing protein n=1 Tax=Clostridium botulinum TaxID=1491 RepID=UPI0004D6D1D8|nr:hemoblobin-interacting domain-containing protein [Clostridium botulinum]KEI05451.1 hypothetical protein Z952_05250 [Clostridium botulinum C/D str. BKT75002]KEI09402.1 hypothetical protein Z954_12780 [Clostridium botulinum C/D str. BKT2873]QPW61470.1 DUF1533 domain-containing protein [Clostridium botulinum]
MSKKTRLLIALVAGLISCNVTTVFAAPTDIYGYKKLAIWDFHENFYDKNGNIRITPGTTVFDTHGQFQSKDKYVKKSSKREVNEPLVIKRHRKVDLMSSASHHSSGGSSSHKPSGGSDVVSGASNFIGADVVYDFDMLSNAVILKNLGVEDDNINKIINNWNTTTRTAITERGMDFGTGLGVDYDSYINKATEAYMNGRDLTFEEFAKNNKSKTRNLPYKAKYILEDGTYGNQMVISEINALIAPNIQVNNDENIIGKDLVLKFDNDEKWANAILDVQVGESLLNNNTHKISRNKLKIYKDKIVIPASKLSVGENVFKIHANGYRTVTLKQNIVKGKVIPKLADKYYVNNNVEIDNLSQEYLTSIKNIVFNGKVLKNGQWFINTQSKKLILDKSLFKDSGYYKVTIDTDKKFEVQLLNIEVKNANDQIISEDDHSTSKEKIVPILIANDVQQGEKDIQIEFKSNKEWEKSVYKIQKIDLAPGLYKDLEFKVSSGTISVKQNSNSFLKNNIYQLRIFAKGYEPADVYVNLYKIHPEITLECVPTIGKVFKLGMSRGTFDYDWIDNIKEVYMDGKLLTQDNQYLKAIERLEIKPSAVISSGKHRIIIKSIGFNDVVKDVVYFNEDGTRPNVTIPSAKKEVALKEVPENVSTNVKDVKVGGSLIINNANYGDYKVKSIILNGAKLKENKDFITSILGNVLISENVLNKVGQSSIVLQAHDYKDKEIKIEVKAIQETKSTPQVNTKPQKDNTINDDSNKKLKKVSSDVKVNGSTTINTGEKLGVNPGFDFGYTVSEVYLNGAKLDNKSCDISIFGIKIKENVLTKVGENTITLKSKGYEDKDLKITVKGKDIKEEKPSTKENHKVLKKVPENVKTLDNRKTFKVGEEVSIYVPFGLSYDISEIYLNGVKLDKNSCNISSIFGTTIKRNVLSKEGENIITLKANGFEDKEINIVVNE